MRELVTSNRVLHDPRRGARRVGARRSPRRPRLGGHAAAGCLDRVRREPAQRGSCADAAGGGPAAPDPRAAGSIGLAGSALDADLHAGVGYRLGGETAYVAALADVGVDRTGGGALAMGGAPYAALDLQARGGGERIGLEGSAMFVARSSGDRDERRHAVGLVTNLLIGMPRSVAFTSDRCGGVTASGVVLGVGEVTATRGARAPRTPARRSASRGGAVTART